MCWPFVAIKCKQFGFANWTNLRYCLSSDSWVITFKTQMKKPDSLSCKGINTKLAILQKQRQ